MTWKSLPGIVLIAANVTPLLACPRADIDSAKKHLDDGNYGRSVAILDACIQDNESPAEVHFLIGSGR